MSVHHVKSPPPPYASFAAPLAATLAAVCAVMPGDRFTLLILIVAPLAIPIWGVGGALASALLALLYGHAPLQTVAFSLLCATWLMSDEERLSLRYGGYLLAALAGFSFIILVMGAPPYSLARSLFTAGMVALVSTLATFFPHQPLITRPFRSGMVVVAFVFCAEADWLNGRFAESPLIGLGLSLALGAGALAERKIDRSGFYVGLVLGTAVYTCVGPTGFGLLTVALLLAVAAGGYGNRGNKKTPPRRGTQVAANIGPATLFAILSLFAASPAPFVIGFAASLGALLSDTVAGELGQRFDKKPFDILTRLPVRVGENGAVSPIGLFIGGAGALIIGGGTMAVGLGDITGALIVSLAAFTGNLLDSLFGSLFENQGFLDNDRVNAWSTLMAGLMATLMAITFL